MASIFDSTTDTSLDLLIDALVELLQSSGIPIPPEMLQMGAPAIGGWLDSLSGIPGLSSMMLRSTQTGAGIFGDNRERRTARLKRRVVNDGIKEEAYALALAITRSLYSEDTYNPAEHGGMSYETFTAIEAASMSDNGIFRLLYKQLDPTGGVALANARGDLFADIANTGMQNGDIRAYLHAKAVSGGLFKDANGRSIYDSTQYNGFTEAAATYLAGALTQGRDPLEGISTSDTDKVQAKLQELREKTQEITDALAPLRDIYGTDIPKLLQDIEALTGQSVQTIDSARLRTLSLELGSRAAAGLYDMTDVAKGKQAVDTALSDAGYKGLSRNYTSEQSIAMNDRGNQMTAFWFQPEAEGVQMSNDAVIGAYNSPAADTINSLYGFARQRGLVGSLDEFRSIYANSSDPIGALMQFFHSKGIYMSAEDLAMAGKYNTDAVREAFAASLGGDAVLGANASLIMEDAAMEQSFNPYVQSRMRGKTLNDIQNLGMQALTLVGLDPSLVNMSEEDRIKTLQEMLADPNRKFTTADGTKKTLSEMGVTSDDVESLSLLINGFTTTESGQAALSAANQSYSQGKSRFQATVQKQLMNATKELLARVPTTFQQFAKQVIENRDPSGAIRGFNNQLFSTIDDITKGIEESTGDVELASYVGITLNAITAGEDRNMQKQIEEATGNTAREDFFKLKRKEGLSEEEIQKQWESEKESRTYEVARKSQEAIRSRAAIISDKGMQSEAFVSTLESLQGKWDTVRNTQEYAEALSRQQEVDRLKNSGASQAEIERAEEARKAAWDEVYGTAEFKDYAATRDSLNRQAKLLADGTSPETLDKMFQSPEAFSKFIGRTIDKASKREEADYAASIARRNSIGDLETGEMGKAFDEALGGTASADSRQEHLNKLLEARRNNPESELLKDKNNQKILSLYDERQAVNSDIEDSVAKRQRLAEAASANDIFSTLSSGGILTGEQTAWLEARGYDPNDPALLAKLQDTALAGVDQEDINGGVLNFGAEDYLNRIGITGDKAEGVMSGIDKYQKWLDENGGTVGAKSFAEWAKTDEGRREVEKNGYDTMVSAVVAGAEEAGIETSDFGGMGELVNLVRGIFDFLTGDGKGDGKDKVLDMTKYMDTVSTGSGHGWNNGPETPTHQTLEQIAAGYREMAESGRRFR